MATARKLPSGSWRVRVFYKDENGENHTRSFTCDDPSPNGKKKVEKMAADFAKYGNFYAGNGETLGTLLEGYIKVKNAVLSPSTIRGYTNTINVLKKHYNEFYGISANRIDTENIQRLVSKLSEDKSPKTVRNYYGLISATLEHKNIKIGKIRLPQKVDADLPIPENEDVKKLVEVIRDTELEIPVLLAAFCTMRRGEICALSLDDIEGTLIHIKHSLVLGTDKEWHLKAPKTNSSDRYVDAPQFVIDRINEVGHITNLNPHSLTIMFQRVLQRNNIEHFRFHALRSYSASIKHAMGIPDVYIMADGGWATPNTLNKVYKKVLSNERKKMSEKQNSYFEKMFATQNCHE